MDDRVIAALARWPDVPDVFGWLSLNARGHWRLHPEGDALARAGSGKPVHEGVSISSQRINQFINRNYVQDARHQWYFQNGPQRVYVRLDAAPFVLHTIDRELDQPVFLTHNGLRTRHVARWCLDDAGRLYAQTDVGAGLIAGHDLEQILCGLTALSGDDLFEILADTRPGKSNPIEVRWGDGPAAPLCVCVSDDVPDLLGFVRYPQPISCKCA